MEFSPSRAYPSSHEYVATVPKVKLSVSIVSYTIEPFMNVPRQGQMMAEQRKEIYSFHVVSTVCIDRHSHSQVGAELLHTPDVVTETLSA